MQSKISQYGETNSKLLILLIYLSFLQFNIKLTFYFVNINIGSKTYFSSEKYPSNGGFIGQGFIDLKKALQLAATKCGYNITSNGGDKSLQTFTCKHTRKYRNNIQSRQDLQYRKRSFHNDKRNTRGYEGRHLPRLSNTY